METEAIARVADVHLNNAHYQMGNCQITMVVVLILTATVEDAPQISSAEIRYEQNILYGIIASEQH